MNHHKRGFTLTELLIVVIVIGILSAVVLPRYNKTLETRKTTEAEDILSAIRTEQERRCTLGKKYVTDMASLSEIVPNATTDNYEYSLVPTSVVGEGISYRTVSARAISRGSYDYGLYMFSNSDGRICCAGPDCTKLNKDYPLCEELQRNTDLLKAATEEAYECGTRSVTPIPNPPAPRPWEEQINGEFVLDKDPDDGGGSGGGDGGDDGDQGLDNSTCSGPAERACGCKNTGTQTRTCNTQTGQWSEWSTCDTPYPDAPDDCECEPGHGFSEHCGCGTTGPSHVVSCLANGTYSYGKCNECEDDVIIQYDTSSWRVTRTIDSFGQNCNASSRRKVRYCNKTTGTWNWCSITYNNTENEVQVDHLSNPSVYKIGCGSSRPQGYTDVYPSWWQQ